MVFDDVNSPSQTLKWGANLIYLPETQNEPCFGGQPTPKIEGPQPDNQVQVQIRKPPHCFHGFSYLHFLPFRFFDVVTGIQKFCIGVFPPLKRSEARAFLHDPHVLVVHRPVDELDSSVASKKVGRLRQQRRWRFGLEKTCGAREGFGGFAFLWGGRMK